MCCHGPEHNILFRFQVRDRDDNDEATKTLGVALAVLLLPHIAVAETWLTLEASEYPPEVKKALDDVRSACKGEEHEVVDDPQAGVTIIDLDRDGSKDILLEAWRTCSVEMKGAG